MPGLLDLRRLRLAPSLAKLASLAQTMLSLLYLRRLRFNRSFAELASFAQTMLGLLVLRQLVLFLGGSGKEIQLKKKLRWKLQINLLLA